MGRGDDLLPVNLSENLYVGRFSKTTKLIFCTLCRIVIFHNFSYFDRYSVTEWGNLKGKTGNLRISKCMVSIKGKVSITTI